MSPLTDRGSSATQPRSIRAVDERGLVLVVGPDGGDDVGEAQTRTEPPEHESVDRPEREALERNRGILAEQQGVGSSLQCLRIASNPAMFRHHG
jgi:hypothetical protein